MTRMIVAALVFSMATCAQAGPHGEISVCRAPGIDGALDGKPVHLSSVPGHSGNRWGSYIGTCDDNGEHCRDIIVTVGRDAVIGHSRNACVNLPAEMTVADGKPLRRRERLLPQWSIPGFNPVVTVTRDFR